MADSIYFEGREIPSYGEPISEYELKDNSIYYIVNFVDEEMIIPTMDTVVFIGKNLEDDEVDSYYFQDIDSYNDGVKYIPGNNDSYGEFFVCSKKELNGVYDFEHALERLMHCFLRQQSKKH
jgi:hypothetical protein